MNEPSESKPFGNSQASEDLITVAGVQMDVALMDMEANLQAMETHLGETARRGALLTVFPECALTGYCFDSLEEALPYAESIPGPSTERLAKRCAELNVFAVYGLLEKDGDDLFNACVLIGPEGLVGSYRKIHLPYLGIDRFTTPGNRPFAVQEAGPLKIGMNICYDGSFPESSRIMALQGADLIVLPTNWPPGAKCTADYVINTRAMENATYYMAVDRVGNERGFDFIGQSRICEPNGDTVAWANHTDEEILYAQLDLRRSRNKHLVRVPEKHEIHRFADRQPQWYAALTEPVQSHHKRKT